ncbi:MAG: RidA family protein [Rhodospirillaceae bacterium]|nr:RidA family protein [Rhodospirillaceae bacterium]
MPDRIDRRLRELGIVLPAPAPAFASYLPWKISGKAVYISGQGPLVDGRIEEKFCGRVGSDLTVEEGQAAARLTALNVLAQLKDACGGDLDRVAGCIQLMGFVNCDPGFTQTPTVINGGSDVIVAVFGENGRHARYAIGSHALPANISVEIAAIFEIG